MKGGGDDDKVRGGRGICCQHGLATASLHVLPHPDEVEDDGGLEMIGQPEIEAAQLATLPMVSLRKSCVGIVWPVLVDNIAYKTEIRWRLYAEAPTMANSLKPY